MSITTIMSIITNITTITNISMALYATSYC